MDGGKEINATGLMERIRRRAGTAIARYGLIRRGDRLLLAISGGKDSLSMAAVLAGLKSAAPVDFELEAVTIDPGFGQADFEPVGRYLESLGIRHVVLRERFDEIIRQRGRPDGSRCAFCARLRRGTLYSHAAKGGFSRIALAHHADDAVETLLLSLFHNGRLKSMPPALRSDDGRNLVIRPLILCRERLLRDYAAAARLPVTGCPCPAGPDHRRAEMKRLLARLEGDHPDAVDTALSALGRVVPDHLHDDFLFDFASLEAGRSGDGG